MGHFPDPADRPVALDERAGLGHDRVQDRVDRPGELADPLPAAPVLGHACIQQCRLARGLDNVAVAVEGDVDLA